MIPKQAFFDYFKPLILSAWALTDPTVTPLIIWANPNAPEPPAPCFVLRATLTNTSAHSQVSDVDAQGMQTVSDQAEATVTVTGVGVNTYAALEDVATSCRKPSSVALALSLDLALIDRPRVTDVTGLLNQIQMEERGVLSTTVRFVNTVSDNVGLIETVNMEGTFTGSIQEGATQDITVVLNTTP